MTDKDAISVREQAPVAESPPRGYEAASARQYPVGLKLAHSGHG